MLRYHEELCLIQEEKRRILVSFEATAQLWERREADALTSTDGCQIYQHGLAAYAAKQARIRRGLAQKFTAIWNTPLPTPKGNSTDAEVADTDGTLLITLGVIDSINYNLFEGRMMTLPVYVYRQYQQGLVPCRPDQLDCIATVNFDRAWAAALVLIIIVLVLNLVARLIARWFAPSRGH